MNYRGRYIGSQTHINVKSDWLKTHSGIKLNNLAIRKLVIIGLQQGLSPQVTAGRLREKYGIKIHLETIYQYIYKQEPKLTQYLFRRKYGRKPRQIRHIKKGTVENINGLICPKGTNFDTIKHKEIKQAAKWINNRSMKVLGYKTPNEVFQELNKLAS